MEYRITLGTGTALEMGVDRWLTTGSSGNSSVTNNNNSGGNNSGSRANNSSSAGGSYIPDVLHPPISDPQLPQLPPSSFLHSQLGNSSVGQNTSVGQPSYVANNPATSLNPELPLTAFYRFGLDLEARCLALLNTKPASRNGTISITLSDLGIKKYSHDWNMLSQAFPKPDHDDACFANSLHGKSYRHAVVWSNGNHHLRRGNSVIDRLKTL